jgi:hypothetical protein
MSTATNRLDEIVSRQRKGRVRDVAFAILVALVVIFQVTALRAAVANANSRTPVANAPAASAPATLDAGSQSCASTPVC